MRHAIVTAGSRGLGRKVTELFLEKGYSVTVSYHNNQTGVEQLQEKYASMRDRLLFIRCDVTKKEDLIRLIDQTYQCFGRIDCLVNNAGPYIFERKKLADYSDQEWYEMIEGNLSSVFHLVKRTIPIMRKQKYGRIITYGFQGAGDASGWLHRSAFSAAKTGLVSLTKTIAIEEAENGITANMVCPGNITAEMKEATIEEARKHIDVNTPIGRSGTGEDIARIITFLCDEQSDFITGAIIEATGAANVIHRFHQ
ncbi:MAG: SDR family NAD(P)-dependent oxidoreductase [Bacillaceae bacterium]|uniref:3-ketoacyl-ACP reductase n=2 Tax=Aeribacillus TaxID=1055323 RepID=A0A165YJ34_9BACI|nr:MULTISPECIES: SDR family oxidoreductase [Aeribacillus]REJ20750.1 MAG: SDR family NAD(P)-dependent oxidoreductase [Bacillaceae bacterium]ASS92151.1 3-oxoacyl-ACP reductase [Aeribacillus pallidus]KZN97132.1 3-ketoacyl-ACP reductase [Aeribacillus pallidus]MDR9791650.1 SDR family oxidoreductase [Aeribacillus pallidus]MDR9796784.1 SDR family oxidoreductase [Aeribacillus pallidus]